MNRAQAGDLSPLDLAILIAVNAHAGQLDDDGFPYVLHPLRVMGLLRKPASAAQRMVAVLHDTIEQTSVTGGQLLAMGIPADVVEAVEILTRPPTESRIAAVRRAMRNPLACAVKRADIIDNMDFSRIPRPQPADFERLAEYRQALELLDGQSQS